LKKIKRLIILFIIVCLFLYFYKNINIIEKFIKFIYPIKYLESVEKYSKEFEIDEFLIYSIIKVESNFDSKVKSKSGAIGLMQIMEQTAKEIDNSVTEEELFNEDTNIRIGVEYFSKLLIHYNNNLNLAIIAYNAGMGNVDKWIENGIIKEDGSDIENVPFKETNNYVRKILRDYKIYQKIYL